MVAGRGRRKRVASSRLADKTGIGAAAIQQLVVRPVLDHRPLSSTMIWSARRTVESRCAMVMVVRLLPAGRGHGSSPAPSRCRARSSPRRAAGPADRAGGCGRGTGATSRRREAVSPLADHGVVPVGQRRDEVVHLRGPGGRVQVLVAGVGPGEAQVLRDAGMEQVGVLRHHPQDVVSDRVLRSRTSTPS